MVRKPVSYARFVDHRMDTVPEIRGGYSRGGGGGGLSVRNRVKVVAKH